MGDKVDDFVAQLEAEQAAKKAEPVEKIEAVNEEIGDIEDVISEAVEPEIITEEQATDVKAESSEDDLLDSIANANEETIKPESLPKNVQKKINRDNAARKQAEEESARLRQEIAQLRMQQTANPPSPANFTDSDEIDESLPISEQVELLLARKEKRKQLDASVAAETARIDRLSELAAQKAEKARAIFDDYDEIVFPVAQQFSNKPHILLAIPQCENMGKVMYYLGKNPAFTADLLRTTDSAEAIMKLGKLDARLSQKPTSKKVSTAPKPTEKVGSTAGHGSKAPDVIKMDSKQFREFYKTL